VEGGHNGSQELSASLKSYPTFYEDGRETALEHIRETALDNNRNTFFEHNGEMSLDYGKYTSLEHDRDTSLDYDRETSVIYDRNNDMKTLFDNYRETPCCMIGKHFWTMITRPFGTC